MTPLLGGARYVGVAPELPVDTEGYMFLSSDQSTHTDVLWSVDGEVHTMSLPPGVMAYGAMAALSPFQEPWRSDTAPCMWSVHDPRTSPALKQPGSLTPHLSVGTMDQVGSRRSQA